MSSSSSSDMDLIILVLQNKILIINIYIGGVMASMLDLSAVDREFEPAIGSIQRLG